MIVDYIDGHREEFGVESICKVMQIAPSTYYAARKRRARSHVFAPCSRTNGERPPDGSERASDLVLLGGGGRI